MYSNGSQCPSRSARGAKPREWHHRPRASLCFSVCRLLQTETVVGVHYCVSTCWQTTNEIWITSSEIWIIWIISIPPTYPSASLLKRLAAMFYVCLLSRCLFYFPANLKAGQLRRGKEPGRREWWPFVQMWPIICCIHCSTASWLSALWGELMHTQIPGFTHTLTSSYIGLIPRQGLFKCTFPLDGLIFACPWADAGIQMPLKCFSPDVWVVHSSLYRVHTKHHASRSDNY